MYFRWLDAWDEKKVSQSDEGKKRIEFSLNADYAFPGEQAADIKDFCRFADLATADPTFFSPQQKNIPAFQRHDNIISFQSDVVTNIKENNTALAKITESGKRNHAVVMFHHWRATEWNDSISNLFARFGITVVEVALPYHFERARPGVAESDYFLSANLGRTIQSMRQGVLDGRRVIAWLKSENYQEISVLGISLGSWIAGLISAHDTTVRRAAFLLAAGSTADVVWQGRATRLVKGSLEPNIGLEDLKMAWKTLNLENFAPRLARPDLNIHFVLGRRDKVVPASLSERYVEALQDAGANPSVCRLNCGHASLSLVPFSIMAGASVMKFLKRR